MTGNRHIDPPRINALLEPFLGPPGDQRLTTNDLEQISTYIDLLLRWNARINLTAIRDPEQIVPRHFGESFFLARHLFPERSASPEPRAQRGNSEGAPSELCVSGEASSSLGARKLRPNSTPGQSQTTNHKPQTSVIDIGSGAGFPALPIKIWAPEIHLTLIEANHRKAAFLREVIRALTLTNVDVIPERAEEVLARLASPSHSGRREEAHTPSRHEAALTPADVVTFRAVEKFDKILPLAASFLAPNGRLALLIGSGQQSSLSSILGREWHLMPIPQSYTNALALGMPQV